MAVSMEQIKLLREKTNAGVLNCKNALNESNGDIDKAVDILRKKGMSVAAKKSTRTAKQGCVESYIHPGGKIGVLVEINCETDFVARNEHFKQLVKDIAMHIAATNPLYLKKEDVPEEVIDKEKEIFRALAKGKPEHILEKMLAGKINKFCQQVCLLEQAFVKDDKITIKDYVTSVIAKVGENILIKRFTCYHLGIVDK
ncbi:MAG: translation elongation factor Ts [Candidatus Omnitrophota bacterium]|nr:MAG: translation elongation factor Ts [Candidatus Omnitrophota bacterium]